MVDAVGNFLSRFGSHPIHELLDGGVDWNVELQLALVRIGDLYLREGSRALPNDGSKSPSESPKQHIKNVIQHAKQGSAAHQGFPCTKATGPSVEVTG